MNDNDSQQTWIFFIALGLLVPGALTYLGDLGTFRTSNPSLLWQVVAAPVTGAFLITESRMEALVAGFFFWLVILGGLALLLWNKLLRPILRKAQINAALVEELAQEKMLNQERSRIRNG